MSGVLKFRNDGAPDSFSDVRRIVLRQGSGLRVLAKRSGLPLTAPQGAVGIRITTGALRSCALFEGPSVLRDEVNAFVARGSSAATLADCADGSLGGPTGTTTTASTTTSTTLSGVCGDGVVNHPSEECDGTDVSGCLVAGPLFSSCGPPGFSTACRCCSNGGPYATALGCCNPSSILIPTGPPQGGECVPTRCDPPFTCGADQCQPDGSCCAPLGGTCAVFLSEPGTVLNACCPGLECFTQTQSSQWGLVLACCAYGGAACASDADCCAQVCTSGVCEGCRPSGGACASDTECCHLHCGSSGTCDPCRTGGAPCGSFLECCSRSCNPSGTCDPCGSAGAPCLVGQGTCCSGSCNPSTFACDP